MLHTDIQTDRQTDIHTDPLTKWVVEELSLLININILARGVLGLRHIANEK